MAYRRILGAALCFASSVGGLLFYRNSTIQPKKTDFRSLVRVNGFQIHEELVKSLTDVENFEIREGDVLIVTFPKSGTTWVQEIVYLLFTDLDFSRAGSINLDERSPFLEFPCPGLASIKLMPSPRLIKTHLPLCLIPKAAREKRVKIIYVARNPRDVCVSYYHFCKKLSFIEFKGTFKEFVDCFIKGYVPYGPWWKHVRDYWRMERESNVLFVTYEDLHSKNEESIKRIAKFLEKPVTDNEIRMISEYCKFDRMARNERANYGWLDKLGLSSGNIPFMRKGQFGDWQNYFEGEMCEKMDGLVEKINSEEGSPLKFSYVSR